MSEKGETLTLFAILQIFAALSAPLCKGRDALKICLRHIFSQSGPQFIIADRAEGSAKR